MARRAKRKNPWRGLAYLLLAALTLVVAGFIVRHDVGPSLWSMIIHRAPSHADSGYHAPAASAGGATQAGAKPETLSTADREALSATVRRASH